MPDGVSGLICGDRKFGTTVSLQAASPTRPDHREADRQAGAQPPVPPNAESGDGASQCIDHGQKPRSRETNTLLDGGYGVTSCPRPMFCEPKLLISGSRPVYGKLRPQVPSRDLQPRARSDAPTSAG